MNEVPLYLLILILSCFDFLFHYKFLTHIKKDMTIKQKSYIMSIKCSLTMFFVGVFFNYQYFSPNVNDNSIIGIFSVLYFTAYLITDLYIGNKDYPESMNVIAGNTHHIVYICINIISLYFNIYPLYLLFMLSELPTFLLALGSFDSTLRNNTLFGITFFCTRILYHIFLIWICRDQSIIFYLSIIVLCMHLYWFKGWFHKYGFNIKTNKKTKLKTKLKTKQKKSLKTTLS